MGTRHQDELADTPSVAVYLEIELASLHCKLQTRPLVREGASHQQTLQLSKNDQREKEKNWSRVPDGCLRPRWTGRLTVGRNMTLILTLTLILRDNLCEGGIEYLHRSLASHKRRRRRNPVPGGISGPLWVWECFKNWDNKIWSWGPAARVNYRPVLSSERELKSNKSASVWRKFQGEIKVGSEFQMGAWTGLLTVGRNVTSTSITRWQLQATTLAKEQSCLGAAGSKIKKLVTEAADISEIHRNGNLPLRAATKQRKAKN
jgi:hypothetical protein